MKKIHIKKNISEDKAPKKPSIKHIKRSDRPRQKDSYSIGVIVAVILSSIIFVILYNSKKTQKTTIIKVRNQKAESSKIKISNPKEDSKKPQNSDKIVSKEKEEEIFLPSIKLEKTIDDVTFPKKPIAKKQEKKIAPKIEKKEQMFPKKQNPKEQIFLTMLSEAQKMNAVGDYLHLANWCKANGMKEKSISLYQKILAMAPENTEVRKSLGFIKIEEKWVKENEAIQLGYYKYQGQWYSKKELAKKGLIQHQGIWLTKKEAIEKGWIEAQKQNIAQKPQTKKEEKPKENPEKKEKKVVHKPLAIVYKTLKIYLPPGNWSKIKTSLFAQKASSMTSEFIYKEAESDLLVVVYSYKFSCYYLFDPHEFRAEGDNVSSLVKGIKHNMEQHHDHVIIRKTNITNYYTGTSLNKLDKVPYFFSLYFVKNVNYTYCILQNIPQKNAFKGQYIMMQIAKNVVRLKK